jgi:hypothetical protein
VGPATLPQHQEPNFMTVNTTQEQRLKIRREQKIQRQANLSHFTKFGKIQWNSGKFDRNAFDERKEHEFFENMKIGRIGR